MAGQSYDISHKAMKVGIHELYVLVSHLLERHVLLIYVLVNFGDYYLKSLVYLHIYYILYNGYTTIYLIVMGDIKNIMLGDISSQS